MIISRQAQFWRCSWELISDSQIANRVSQAPSSVDFLKPKVISQFTLLLQQSHTCFNKATPSNASQTVLLTENQTFKHLNTWGPFLFKPPQIPNWSLWVSLSQYQSKAICDFPNVQSYFSILWLIQSFLVVCVCIVYFIFCSLVYLEVRTKFHSKKQYT